MILNSKNFKMLDLTNVNIVCNMEHKNTKKIEEVLVAYLESKGITPTIDYVSFDNCQRPKQYNTEATFVITIGGDGTILSTARFYSNFNVPVFGINSGRLGFLAQVGPSEIDFGLEKIFTNQFLIEDRPLLKAKVNGKSLYALNDFVIKGATLARTQRLYLKINGKTVCDYLADGLIIATPTGSTAYTLSAGGPILTPSLDAVVIVPICPHSLTTRPLVIPSSEKIEIETCDQCDLAYLTGDGQESLKLNNNDVVEITQSDNWARLVLLDCEEKLFYEILREKLNWGIPPKG